MKIRILCVGKLKEKYLREGIAEYVKRLKGYTQMDIIEVPDERIPERASALQEEAVKDREGERLLRHIKPQDYVILLDVTGRQQDSVVFAKSLEQLMIQGKSTIDFVIGGSLGHGQAIYARADERLSFSKMTFPHQLMRLILVEQVYRAFKIIKNETYHK